ncbi:MAG: xanthine dehydrogenase small subunit [Pseudomonadota bacterium]
MNHPIHLTLNGKPVVTPCRADTTVLEYLRGEAQLRGTKEGCAEGDCGACSVLYAPSGKDGALQPANACILLMGQVDGGALMTVEGLANSAKDGHPVQQHMAENGSSQCGFCTPGIVTALAGLLEKTADPSVDEVHDALAGNLCRCTGYRPIVEAALAAAKDLKPNLATADEKPSSVRSTFAGPDESMFMRPDCLEGLMEIRKAHPDAVLLAGGTDLSLDVAHARSRWPRAILTQDVREMRGIEDGSDAVVFGAAVTWQEMLPLLHHYWPSFATLVRRFGSTQIRSMGTLGGNLGTASPIGDGAPALLALDATLGLAGPDGKRSMRLHDYFLDYRKTALLPDEVIVSVTVPKVKSSDLFRVYKVSKRYDQDISTVCGAFHLAMDQDTITEAHIAFGGMAAVPVRLPEAERALIGKALDAKAVAAARSAIAGTLTPMSDMRGSAAYRAKVAGNLLQRLAAERAGQKVEVMAL